MEENRMFNHDIKKLIVSLALVMLVVLAGCAGGGGPSPSQATIQQTVAGVNGSDGTRYNPVWLTPQVSGEGVSLLISDITASKMSHFWVNMPSGKEGFMAYRLDGVDYVRASICPPCRSTSFSLEKGTLVCDACGTIFNAKTGQGISGACKGYPKEAAPASISGGILSIALSDLEQAYSNTLQPG
jgi:nitrite reductase/ring-hydroxylating ferredoxin subunit